MSSQSLLHYARAALPRGRLTTPFSLRLAARRSVASSSPRLVSASNHRPSETATTVVRCDNGSSSTIKTGIFFGGQWHRGSGEPLEVYNPATGEHLATVDTASAEDVDAAVKSARKAFKETWGTNVTPTERGRLLARYADIVEENIEELSALEAADGGKPLQWARADLQSSLAAMRYYAGAADKIHGQSIEIDDSSRQVFTRREPIGVAGQIIPWNFPAMMWAWKIAPALAAGCSVVMKTAENTPLSVLRLTELYEQVGYPAGAFNLVTGTGKVAGEAIASHMDIDKVAFTGSTAVGRHIAIAAAKSNLKVVTLELGGKSPNIVFPSANLEEAAKWAAFGLFETAGQSCIVGSRILVHESVHDQFVKLLVARVAEMEVGKGPDAFYGSLISKVQFEKVLGYIETGKREGAKLEIGGESFAPKGHKGQGFFVKPTVFSNVGRDSTLGTEEIFGPVASVLKFSSETDAIALANDTAYGLAAAVHTTDASQVPRITRQLQAGTVWVNQYSGLSPQAPFGGFKASGWGRELGSNGIEAYTVVKTVNQYYGDDLTWPFKL